MCTSVGSSNQNHEKMQTRFLQIRSDYPSDCGMVVLCWALVASRPPSGSLGPCEFIRTYVYDLPGKFHRDLLMSFPWRNRGRTCVDSPCPGSVLQSSKFPFQFPDFFADIPILMKLLSVCCCSNAGRCGVDQGEGGWHWQVTWCMIVVSRGCKVREGEAGSVQQYPTALP